MDNLYFNYTPTILCIIIEPLLYSNLWAVSVSTAQISAVKTHRQQTENSTHDRDNIVINRTRHDFKGIQRVLIILFLLTTMLWLFWV